MRRPARRRPGEVRWLLSIIYHGGDLHGSLCCGALYCLSQSSMLHQWLLLLHLRGSHLNKLTLLVALCLQANQFPVGNTGCYSLLVRSLGHYYMSNRFHNLNAFLVQLNVLCIGYPPVSFRNNTSPPAYILNYNTLINTIVCQEFMEKKFYFFTQVGYTVCKFAN